MWLKVVSKAHVNILIGKPPSLRVITTMAVSKAERKYNISTDESSGSGCYWVPIGIR